MQSKGTLAVGVAATLLAALYFAKRRRRKHAALDGAHVSLHGPSIPGSRKFLGGSPNLEKTALLGVPANHRYVVKLDLTTGHVSTLPTAVPRGKFKWLRGVLASDGSIFCIPACADCVLRIHADGAITTLGHEAVAEAASTGPGEWLWHGGALGSDGKIWCIPANASRVMCIDPLAGVASLVGPVLHAGLTNRWYGGIKALDGAIWGVPYNAPSALKIVPATGEVLEVGTLAAGGFKWHGGIRSGRYIVGTPSHSTSVLVIDTEENTLTTLDTGLARTGRGYLCGGGVSDDRGNVWCVPSDAPCVVKVTPATGGVRILGGLPPGKNKWQGGVLGRDGNVYCIPCDASSVLCIHVHTGEVCAASRRRAPLSSLLSPRAPLCSLRSRSSCLRPSLRPSLSSQPSSRRNTTRFLLGNLTVRVRVATSLPPSPGVGSCSRCTASSATSKRSSRARTRTQTAWFGPFPRVAITFCASCRPRATTTHAPPPSPSPGNGKCRWSSSRRRAMGSHGQG